MGKISAGEHRLETPVGTIKALLHGSDEVTIENVHSYRLAKSVAVKVDGYGIVTGDIAWGGNWFYLVEDSIEDVRLDNVDRLTECTWRIRQALAREGITGEGGQEIDHVELFGPARTSNAHSKNFVLCPGKAYDRSPCGTGTSAKLACLAADDKLREGERWSQESIVGSVFEGSYRRHGDKIIPSITGSAYVTAEATLILDPCDPFRTGIHA